MATYIEFRDKYNGKLVDANGNVPGQGAYGQCVDIVNLYISEVLGLPIVLGTNAQDFPSKCLPPNYEYIKNSPTGFPKQGDIIIWGSPDKIGHIAICDTATTTNILSFDQNWPLKSPCKLVNHVYTGTYKVLGWLRFVPPVVDPMAEKDKQIATLSQKVMELDNVTKGLQEKIDILSSEVSASNDIILKWQSEATSAKEQAGKAIAQINAANEEKNKYRRLYEGLLANTPDKMTGVQLIQLGLKKLLIKK